MMQPRAYSELQECMSYRVRTCLKQQKSYPNKQKKLSQITRKHNAIFMKSKVTKEVGNGDNVGEDKCDQNITHTYTKML